MDSEVILLEDILQTKKHPGPGETGDTQPEGGRSRGQSPGGVEHRATATGLGEGCQTGGLSSEASIPVTGIVAISHSWLPLSACVMVWLLFSEKSPEKIQATSVMWASSSPAEQ